MKLNDKYRPTNFGEMIGNSSLKKSLPILLKQENHPHTFLFSGPRGTGKTTTARIACDILGIEKENVYELDMADKDIRGIKGASIIKQKCKFRGFGNKSIAFILDEFHQCTKDFANSMLKIFEEPPEFIYFLACTTEPEKLIKTMYDRCSEYRVSKPTSRQMIKYITSICEKEDYKIEFDIIEKIAESADNNPRVSIKLLEQIVPLESKLDILNILEKGITDELETEAIELCRVLVNKGNWTKAKNILFNLKTDNVESIRHMILNYIMKCLLNSNGDKRLADILYEFREPFYNSGKSGLVRAIHDCIIK